MATTQRQYPGAAIGMGGARAASLSGASTGIKLTYTVPAGRQARITGAWIRQTAGAATIGTRASIGGTACQGPAFAGDTTFAAGICLDTGDSFSLTVAVLDAATLFDGVISAEEYLAQ